MVSPRQEIVGQCVRFHGSGPNVVGDHNPDRRQLLNQPARRGSNTKQVDPLLTRLPIRGRQSDELVSSGVD